MTRKSKGGLDRLQGASAERRNTINAHNARMGNLYWAQTSLQMIAGSPTHTPEARAAATKLWHQVCDLIELARPRDSGWETRSQASVEAEKARRCKP